jgi:hypothetical protein
MKARRADEGRLHAPAGRPPYRTRVERGLGTRTRPELAERSQQDCTQRRSALTLTRPAPRASVRCKCGENGTTIGSFRELSPHTRREPQEAGGVSGPQLIGISIRRERQPPTLIERCRSGRDRRGNLPTPSIETGPPGRHLKSQAGRGGNGSHGKGSSVPEEACAFAMRGKWRRQIHGHTETRPVIMPPCEWCRL